MKRVLATVSAFAMLTAACGGNDSTSTTSSTTTVASTSSSSTSTTSSTTTTSTTTTSTTSTTTTSTTTTTMAPAFVSTDVAFDEVVAADPDPLETIEPLTGVQLTVTRDGHVGFTFDEVLYGDPNVRLQGLPAGYFLACSTFVDGGVTTTQCVVQTPTDFPVVDLPTPEDFPENTAWLPNVSVDGDAISVEIDGEVYSGGSLQVEDGPVFVQIDPNTGGLAEPVTRRTGEISAADFAAALNG